MGLQRVQRDLATEQQNWMTQRDEMGREVGGDSGWGTHAHPWWIHVNVWQNQYNIVINLQLK